jgi:hypothetical protein
MDGKTVAIAALVLTAMLLAGIVGSALRPQPAYGQGGVYSTYLALSAEVRDGYAHFVITDTQHRRLIFYEFNPSQKTLSPADGVDLVDNFRRKLP